MDAPNEPSAPLARGVGSGLLSVLVGLVAVVVVAWWMTRPPPPPPLEQAKPPFIVPVTLVALERGDVAEEVELVGDVAAPERARLAFERAGRLKELPIRLGDVVKRGDPLAWLDDTVMEQEVRSAEASLAQARTMADLAQRDAKRLHELEGVDVSKAALDRADSQAANERAKVAQMEADLALRRAQLAQGRLAAPFDAVVTARPVALGDYMDAGDVCCELLSLEEREAWLEIPSTLVGLLAPGAPVTLTSDALPGFSLAATLAAVLPGGNERARTFRGVVRVAAAADPQRRLQPGLFVRARATVREAKQALVAPADAVIESPEGARVAIAVAPAQEGKPPTAAFVPVAVLARTERKVAIAPTGDATLAADASVILTGKENVYPGALILPAAPPAAKSEPAAGAAGGP